MNKCSLCALLAFLVFPLSAAVASIFIPETFLQILELKPIMVNIIIVGMVICIVFALILNLKLTFEKA